MMANEVVQPKTLKEFEVAAAGTLHSKGLVTLLKYLSHGDKQTRRDIQASFNRYWLRPNVLTAKQPVPSTWTTVLGHPIRVPICVAPTADLLKVAPPDGDFLAAQATADAGTLMVYASVSTMPIEEFGSRLPQDGLYWAQTYLYKDKRNTLHMVRNAEKYGFKALVVTVDSPLEYGASSGQVDIVAEYADPSEEPITFTPNLVYLHGKARDSRHYRDDELWDPVDGPAFQEIFSCMPTWEDIAWLKSETHLPIVLKGILSAKAARLAVKAGVDGILVSAHGGRQLPGVQPPLVALPEVLEAVKGRNVEVYLDGEIRCGADALKALALGARAVFIGRPVLWALAVSGKEGVRKTIKIIEDELCTIMTMCGCSSLKDVDQSLLKMKSMY